MCAHDANHRRETLVRTAAGGMGTGPISPEGWALTVVFGVITTVAKRRGLARQQLQVLLGTFSVIVALKGTSPEALVSDKPSTWRDVAPWRQARRPKELRRSPAARCRGWPRT